LILLLNLRKKYPAQPVIGLAEKLGNLAF